MGAAQADQHYRGACLMWDIINDASPDEVGERSEAINNLVMDRLQQALECDPNHLAAQEMRVRLIATELGAYVEAFMEADELAKRAPDNAAYRELREHMRQRAKLDAPSEIPDA